jgi:hypothetical protein
MLFRLPGVQIRTSQYGTFEIGPFASLVAVLAGLSTVGNFVINLGVKLHWWP